MIRPGLIQQSAGDRHTTNFWALNCRTPHAGVGGLARDVCRVDTRSLDVYWRSPEFGDVPYKSRQMERTI